MNCKWQTLIFKMSFWLFLEIFLGALGLDGMADYSEFVFDQKALRQRSDRIAIVS
ncbi:MAG: hypothetical protein J7647_28310 [Cyanobacteria bacterium SBLK]|nr:hypothetical protein [Cyanobacteria bacterium SBLK]